MSGDRILENCTKALVVFVLLVLCSHRCSTVIFDMQPECSDAHTLCPYLASIYECMTQPLYMMCKCVISCQTPNVCNDSSTETTTESSVDNTTITSNDVIKSNDTLCQCRYYAVQGQCSGSIRENCQTTCDLRDSVICPEPEVHNLTTVVPKLSVYRYIDKYKYACIKGYKNVGEDPVMVCIENGTWVVAGGLPLPDCQLKYCGPPPDVAGSSWNATHFYYNGTSTYSCHPGYEMTSSDSAKTCGDAETWTGSVTCEGVNCGPPPAVDHSTHAYNDTRYPDVTTYWCDVGYTWTSGDDVKSCSPEKTWTGTDIVCTAISCGPPPDINNADLFVVTLEYLSTANYTCVKGYNMTGGSDVRTCREDGEWDDEDLICEIVSCGPAPLLENSTVTSGGETYGSTATYTCLTGYRPETGSYVKFCDEFGLWNGDSLVCTLVSCGSVPTIPHSYTSDNVSTLYLSRVNYTCDLGFEQVGGSEVKMCNQYGAWEGESIDCREKPSVAESIGIIKKFEPEVLEAEGSVGLGVAACVIMVVILAAIVLLDLTTIRDHLRFMKANIREYLEQLKVKFLCRPHVIHVSRESPGKDDSG